MDLDLTAKMVGITMADTNLKSAIGLHPEFPLRPGGIYQLFGKVLGHAPVGLWIEVEWIGKPRPSGGIQDWPHGEDHPAYLVQWPWVITMTLHPRGAPRRPIGFEPSELRDTESTEHEARP